MINIIVKRVERHNIKKYKKYKNEPNDFYNTIDDLCWKSKNVYNYANYIVRQEFFKTSNEKEEGLRENANWLRYNQLCSLLKGTEPYKELGSSSSQSTLKKLDVNWSSFFKATKAYVKNPDKFTGRPKLPKYLHKENGRFELGLKNQQFKIVNGHIYFGFTPLKIMNETFKTNIPKEAKLLQIRFVPKNGEYVMEVVYEIEVPDIEEYSKRIASIDLGIDNLMTVTTNCGVNPFVINGKPLKSINQNYNKKIAEMRSALKIRHDSNWSKEMQRFTTKRNNKVDDYIHKSTKMVIDFCKENDIDTLVCGYNKGWKQECDMGKKVNQKFVNIPHESIVSRLTYKCENEGILFKTTEESYTSGTSFLDGEDPIKENYDKSRRVHRGLFVSNNGTKINADVNGSYQIMKKEYPEAYSNGTDCFELHPIIVNI